MHTLWLHQRKQGDLVNRSNNCVRFIYLHLAVPLNIEMLTHGVDINLPPQDATVKLPSLWTGLGALLTEAYLYNQN